MVFTKSKKKRKFFFSIYIISIIVAAFVLCSKFSGEEPDAAGIISLSYLCFNAYAYHKQKLDGKQNFHEKVAWISDIYYFPGGMRPSYLRDWKLYKYIETEQRNLQIPQQYCIDFSSETEKEYLSQILNKHKEHVIEYYFCNRLKETKDIYELKSVEYYFFSLHCFVYDNLSEYKDNDAYKKKEYISDWNFKCQLTEYGRTYYKLYLIAQLYVENNEHIQKLFEYVDTEKKNHIMEVLEKNETQFLQYRP